MEKIPFPVHVLNFFVKYILFVLVFIGFQFTNLITLDLTYLAIFPLLFTIIGVVADWIIVPIFHNIISSLMGSIFMGSVTYLSAVFFRIGVVPFYSAILLALSLGIVEAILHAYIVKPFLKKLKC